MLHVNGWLALSTEKGSLPDAAKLILNDVEGRDYIVSTEREQRLDVGNVFKMEILNGSGYRVMTNVSSLQVASVRMAYEDKGELFVCPQVKEVKKEE